ncbi:ATP-dependent DNA helicase [Piscinibacter sp. XHJ-5]|uniref:ATP-dependent DNA helicase n=1 Tax=Piscinibacter sp. XHJ-5 TaxID=3037797 RepID=UPI00245328E4|nr:ATP-dependent DNA helicase [Piscinibacter sp. XHJ-5]
MSRAYTIAVRALCEFAAKRGDLDLRFTPSPSAQEGIAGHKTVAARRSAAYRAEVPVSGEFRHLVVRGRADGYDPDRRLVEEVKTFKGDLQRMPPNHRELHWAQAKVYGCLLCRAFELPSITVSLVYFDVRTQAETTLEQQCSAEELHAFFEALCQGFIAWADRELAHRAQRDTALGALRFPHDAFRGGQRALAESVFKAARLGRCLMAQAPTGIGKTIGTLFPLLKACPGQALDKVYFLSAKGSGRALALEAMATLRRGPTVLPLRVLELVARDKACEHPDKACHGESCPLARGFYDRLPAAREAAVSVGGSLTKEVLRELALAYQVCPYYLGHELARWADVIVGDYNYYFDSTALLHGLTALHQWRVAVLVDEAHNLVERARKMYSAELVQAELRALRKASPAALKKPLDRLHQAWNALARAQDEPYRVLEEVPRSFSAALQDCTAAITDHLTEHPAAVDSALLQFYFDGLHFGRLVESFGAHSLFDVTRAPGGRGGATLCVRNVVPATFLQPRLAAAHATVLFSATLTPARFYIDTLGLPVDTAWLDVEAPFSADQLSVRIVREVSTRWRHRGDSLAPIVRLMATQYEAAPGNYLAFFSSFDYLQQAAQAFAARHPAIPTWQQARHMDEAQREAFLRRFVDGGRGIAFAVLGGSFAEGIDLPGTRLIGAFIATLGLPQFNPINEEMRRRFDATFGTGYDYTYLFPGIRKVVQAAGRVIRTPSDRGSIHLIDDRFARPEVRKLLPGWWRVDG